MTCHQQAKGQAGFDGHQVRLWQSFHRHTVLSMCALALLAVAAARPEPPAPLAQAADPPVPGPATQPAGWADTGILPAGADEPPPKDPGLVKVSVPEARRLLRLVPMAAPAPGPRPLPPLPDPAPRLPGVSHDQVTNRDCSTGEQVRGPRTLAAAVPLSTAAAAFRRAAVAAAPGWDGHWSCWQQECRRGGKKPARAAKHG